MFLNELFISESLSQVYGILHEFFSTQDSIAANLGEHIHVGIYLGVSVVIQYITDYICYDDVCHLRKFYQNPVRRELTSTTQQMASIPIMVDKMHIAGHVDTWCLDNCDSGILTRYPSPILTNHVINLLIHVDTDL